jgi:hypothetical protein
MVMHVMCKLDSGLLKCPRFNTSVHAVWRLRKQRTCPEGASAPSARLVSFSLPRAVRAGEVEAGECVEVG